MTNTKLLIYIRRTIAITFLIILPLAIAINEFNLSRQRGKQMRNLADMRAIGTAVETYGLDHNAYPIGNSTVSTLRHHLEPVYIKQIPKKDKWGTHFLYHSNDGQSYTITSYGKDQKPDLPKNYKGVITRFTNDITFSQGSFSAFPIGI